MITVKYIPKKIVTEVNLWFDLNMRLNKEDYWYPADNTPDYVFEYLKSAKAFGNARELTLCTQAFAKVLCEKDPDLAVKIGIAREVK